MLIRLTPKPTVGNLAAETRCRHARRCLAPRGSALSGPEFQRLFPDDTACAAYLEAIGVPDPPQTPRRHGPTRSRPDRWPAAGIGKMLVAGAVEVAGGTPRRARLKVIQGFGKGEIHAFVLGAVASNTRLVTDDWPSYNDIPDIIHRAITVGPMAAHIVLPWTHRLFSNLKRWGLGVYHGLRRANLQHYLDEFVFRFNRRRTRHAAFDTLLGIGARTQQQRNHALWNWIRMLPPEEKTSYIARNGFNRVR